MHFLFTHVIEPTPLRREASDYTSMFQAWQLNNIHAVIIVGLALLAGQNISDAEVCGSCMALVGIVMMHAPAILGQGMGIVAGNSIALFGSCGAVMFLDLAGRLRERLPLFVMMVPVSFLNSFLFSVVAVLFESANYSVSDRGAFGWMSPHRILFGLYLGGVGASESHCKRSRKEQRNYVRQYIKGTVAISFSRF